MATICAKCGKTLTDNEGIRLAQAVWDSTLSNLKPPDNDEIVWAWCVECHAKLKEEQSKP